MLTFTNEKHQSSCFYIPGTKNEGKSETHLISNNTNLLSSGEKPSYSSYFGSSPTESCGSIASGFSSESYGTSIASVFSGGGSDYSSSSSFSGCSTSSCSSSCCCSFSC